MILEELLNAFKARRDKKKSEFGRVLPFGEYFSERTEKAQYLGFGEGSTVYDSSLVFGDVRVGKNCWIGPFTILDGSGGTLTICDHCNISACVHIYTHDTVNKVKFDDPVEKAPVTIGDRCYIGPHAVIAKGVTIGSGSVIGAQSLVLSSVGPNSRAHGAPARVIRID